jgi:hypothetical protein
MVQDAEVCKELFDSGAKVLRSLESDVPGTLTARARIAQARHAFQTRRPQPLKFRAVSGGLRAPGASSSPLPRR